MFLKVKVAEGMFNLNYFQIYKLVLFAKSCHAREALGLLPNSSAPLGLVMHISDFKLDYDLVFRLDKALHELITVISIVIFICLF